MAFSSTSIISLCMCSRSTASYAYITINFFSMNGIFTKFSPEKDGVYTTHVLRAPSIRQGCFHAWASVPTGAGTGAGDVTCVFWAGVVSALFEHATLHPQSDIFKPLVYWQEPQTPQHQTTSNVGFVQDNPSYPSVIGSLSEETGLIHDCGALGGVDAGLG